MSLPSDRSKGEQSFIHEYTRNLLIRWADHCIRFGTLPKPSGTASDEAAKVYLDHAISKGWVTKDGTKMTSAGYASAAARCKA